MRIAVLLNLLEQGTHKSIHHFILNGTVLLTFWQMRRVVCATAARNTPPIKVIDRITVVACRLKMGEPTVATLAAVEEAAKA